MVEATARKDVTVQGLRRAIKRGDIISRHIEPGEKRLEVSTASLKHWEVNKIRQNARKRRTDRWLLGVAAPRGRSIQSVRGATGFEVRIEVFDSLVPWAGGVRALQPPLAQA